MFLNLCSTIFYIDDVHCKNLMLPPNNMVLISYNKKPASLESSRQVRTAAKCTADNGFWNPGYTIFSF